MKWYDVKNVEELKELGKLTTVKREINKDIRKITGKKDISGFIKMGSNSWKNQYDKITALKKIVLELSDIQEEALVNKKNSGYFKNEACRYIFCLLELSGEERMKQLKIYKSLYINKEAAKGWYRNIAKAIHPDSCKEERAAEAMAELASIYDKMVSNE